MTKLISAAFLCSFASSAAQAVPATYSFTGTIGHLDHPSGLLPGAVGDQVPISITVDTGAPGSAGSDNSTTYSYGPSGLYTNTKTPIIEAASVGAFLSLQGSSQTVSVEPGQRIGFNTFSYDPNGAFGVYGTEFLLTLFAPAAGTLTSGALPTSLDAGDFIAGTFSLIVFGSPFDQGYNGAINGVGSNVAAVPEPTALSVFAVGALALATRRRRKA